MSKIGNSILELKYLDELARLDSSIHCLAPLSKVLVVLIFCMTVISFGKYEVSALLPFFIFPIGLILQSGLPLKFILKKILLICPFVFAVAIFNPFLDQQALLQIGPIEVSGGWLSFFSILLRSILTATAALVLVGVTGFNSICEALNKIGVPQVFTVQLLFLYRYIFVLTEEVKRTSRGRELRSFGKKGLGISSFSSMMGHMLLRTWGRAERIHMAMLSRGFNGKFHSFNDTPFGTKEFMFMLFWISLFVFMRLKNISLLLNELLVGIQ